MAALIRQDGQLTSIELGRAWQRSDVDTWFDGRPWCRYQHQARGLLVICEQSGKQNLHASIVVGMKCGDGEIQEFLGNVLVLNRTDEISDELTNASLLPH